MNILVYCVMKEDMGVEYLCLKGFGMIRSVVMHLTVVKVHAGKVHQYCNALCS